MEKEVLDFLKKRHPKICTIATVTKDGKPEAATVGYAVQDDLTLLLSTRTYNRKWQNLLHNPYVAIVVGSSQSEHNVQYEGIATLVEKHHPEYETCDKLFFEANPQAEKYREEDTVFMRITPTWIRFLDYTQPYPGTSEKTF